MVLSTQNLASKLDHPVRGSPPNPLKNIIMEQKRERNPGGRPAKNQTQKRSKQLKLSFTESEYQEVLKGAEQLRLKPSIYARKMVLDGEIRDVYSQVSKEEKQQLYGLGNNLNQLAHKAHVAGIYSLKDDFGELLFHIRQILLKYK